MLLVLASCALDTGQATPTKRWPTARGKSSDSVAMFIRAQLGVGPDTLEWCAPARARLVFVNTPLDVPTRLHPDTVFGFVLPARRAVARTLALVSLPAVAEVLPESLTIALVQDGAVQEYHMELRALVVHGDTAPLRTGRRKCA